MPMNRVKKQLDRVLKIVDLKLFALHGLLHKLGSNPDIVTIHKSLARLP